MARSAFIAGRTASVRLMNTIALITMVSSGVIVGFSFHAGPRIVPPAAAAGAVLFGYAMSWSYCYIGYRIVAPIRGRR